jgi:hypothetical protein
MLLENTHGKKLAVLILFGVFLLLFGRMLSISNLFFFDIGYWEKRILPFIFFVCAVLAPFSLVKLVDGIRLSRKRVTRGLVVGTLLGIVVFSGVQSSFIVAEYWTITSNPSSLLTRSELEALDYLGSVFQQDSYAYAITLTSKSIAALRVAAPPYTLSGTQVFSTATGAEIPLLCLKVHDLSHAYLYMHTRDYEYLNYFNQSWLASHLLPTLPVMFSNDEVKIFNISRVSFPQANSKSALVWPFDFLTGSPESWLYAYDMLSYGRYNYTVAYDLDAGLMTYDTLILARDPSSETYLENDVQENFTQDTGWQQISGTWQYTSSGLEAGKPGEFQDAIILTPFSAQNFTASLGFQIIDANSSVSNYVSMIYDWEDEENFKYTGLMFDGSGDVNAFFSVVENGEITNFPEWPGLYTGLSWQNGASFNLTVSVQGNNSTLFINGSKYLSIESNANGLLGVRVTRFYKVLLTSFMANASAYIQTRDIQDYLDFAAEGGTLIILNTDGYHYFATRMLTPNNATIEAYEINGIMKITLPEAVTTPVLLPKDGGIEVIASYISQDNTSIYAASETIGLGQILYLNVNPVITAINLGEDKSIFYETLGALTRSLSLPLDPFIYTYSDPAAIFREVVMTGDIHINASSVLFPLEADYQEIDITHGNSETTTLYNISQIQLSGYENISIEASNLTLTEGRGLYSVLAFSGGVVVKPERSSSASVSNVNGDTNQFSNVTSIVLKDADEDAIFARRLSFEVQGTTAFKELYSMGELYQKTKTQGQDLTVTGNVKMELFLSDTYKWVTYLEATGSFERNPPIRYYSELSTLARAAFWTILLAPIFLIIVLLIERKKSKKSWRFWFAKPDTTTM